MVWHAYMLNPRWYTEDTMRISACKRLKMLELNFTSILVIIFFSLAGRQRASQVGD